MFRSECRGGSNRIGNLVGAHRRCNGEKGSLTGEEYRAVLAVRAAQAGVTEGGDA